MRGKKFQRGQVNLEFAAAFTVMVIFLFAATKIFVWLGNSYIDRHKAYEQTRKAQWEWITLPNTPVNPVVVDFYNQSEHPLSIFGK